MQLVYFDYKQTYTCVSLFGLKGSINHYWDFKINYYDFKFIKNTK